MPRKKEIKPLPPHVHLKNGQWYVGVNFPTSARLANGNIKYRQIARRCYPENETRAAEVLAAIKNDHRLSEESGPTNPNHTLAKFIEIFLAAKKKAVERRTFEFYNAQFNQFIKNNPVAGQVLAKIKPLDVQMFYDGLQSAGASADAIRKLNQFLSAVFNQAVRWETLLKNPAKGVILPKRAAPDTTAMTKAEAVAFIETCRRTTDYIVLEFALETGTRPEEYLALAWDDIDTNARTARIHRAVTIGFNGGGREFKTTKTAGSRRTVVFSEQLAARLEIHRAAQTAKIAEIKTRKNQRNEFKSGTLRALRAATVRCTAAQQLTNFKVYNLVFPAADGVPMSRLNLNRRDFKDAVKKAGLDAKKFSLYSLRRTAATLLASKVNPKELAAFLGHTDVTTSLKYYVMMTDDSKYKASDALSEIFY